MYRMHIAIFVCLKSVVVTQHFKVQLRSYKFSMANVLLKTDS